MPTPIPVRLPPDLIAWLQQRSEALSEPRSVIIRNALRREMERQQRAARRKAQAHSAVPSPSLD